MAKQRQSGRTVDVVEQLCGPVAEQMNLTIWDVTFSREGADWILRILLDSEDGVDLDTAEKFSRAIDPLLDEADPIEQSYSLEVCSAGLNRDLTRDRHFEQCLGAPLIVRTIRPADESGARDFQGVLEGYDRETIRLSDGERITTLQRDNLAFVRLDDFGADEI